MRVSGNVDDVDSVDKNANIIMFMDKSLAVGGKFKKRVNDYVNLKSTWFSEFHQTNHVDNVDNLLTKQAFTDFNDISSTHCYQQVTVNTIFQ